MKLRIVGLLILTEFLSLAGWYYPGFNTVMFMSITATVFLIAWKRMDIALLIALAELFIGSKGYLFFGDGEGVRISIRIALWLVIMSVWLSKSLVQMIKGMQTERAEMLRWRVWCFERSYCKWLCGLAMVLVWGIAFGMSRNEYQNVFFDSNNWLYFLYLLPFGTTFQTQQKFLKIQQVLVSSVAVILLKTGIIFFIFSHNIYWLMQPLYRWVRDSGGGEITFYANNFYRVFFQSHLWVTMGMLMLISAWYYYRYPLQRQATAAASEKRRTQWRWWSGLMVLLSCIIVSFSRSFWVGGSVGLFVFLCFIKFRLREMWGATLSWVFRLAGIMVGGVALVYVTMIAPPHIEGSALGSLLEDRLTGIEAAGSSRMNLIKPLIIASIKHPIVGSGFGSEVTYQSADPRIRSETINQSGEYKTFAFEWGYLDLWLKIGFIGVVMYVGLIISVVRSLHVCMMANDVDGTRENKSTAFGMLLCVVALAVIHVFTPYLNHPLGIGVIIIVIAWLNTQNSKSVSQYTNSAY